MPFRVENCTQAPPFPQFRATIAGDSPGHADSGHFALPDLAAIRQVTTEMKSTTMHTDRGTAVELVNLTPHEVVILTSGGRMVLPPSTTPARLASSIDDPLVLEDGGEQVSIYLETELPSTGLPPFTERVPPVLYVVSRAVAERFPYRSDLVFPSQIVRNPATGTITACASLSRLWEGVPR